MKAEDFLNQRTPRSRGSKLAPAWPEIQKLREANCSLYEIQEFLKVNNIETSVPNLAAFIKRQDAKDPAGEIVDNEKQEPEETLSKPKETIEAAAKDAAPQGKEKPSGPYIPQRPRDMREDFKNAETIAPERLAQMIGSEIKR